MSVEIGKPGLEHAGVGVALGPPLRYRPRSPSWVRLINLAGAGLRRFGLRPALDPNSLMAEARRRAGLDDWGGEGFREGLARLVDAFERQAGAHTFGRLYFRETCVRLLINRLKIQDDLRRLPEIAAVPIRRPLFVTGFPRSGTTLLHRLLAEDPSARSMPFWEALEPSPPPRPETRRTDPRIARARRTTRMLYRLAPGMEAIHLFEAETPEECNALFSHDFAAAMLGFMFDVPDYMLWLGERDHAESYRYYHRQLQLLALHVRGDHWVLKSPAYLFALDSVLEEFPDAAVVQTHRDPKQVVPSLASLAAAFRGIVTDRIDLRTLGAEFLEAMAQGIERAMAARESADPSRFFDASYPSFVADPVGTIRAIYEHFGYDYTAEFEDRMRRYLAENPRGKHGVHRYSLDQFGLSPEEVDARFTPYDDWLATHAPSARAVRR